MRNRFHLVLRSLNYYKKPALFQFLIILLLAAVITGSLLVGSSVKESLKRSSAERLGNTGFLVSSGTRYFTADFPQRLNDSSGLTCVGMLDLQGYCQSLNSQKGAYNIQINAVNTDFFKFHGHDSITLEPGEVAVNKRLSDYLGIVAGDELIIRFTGISDIPRDAPFAPTEGLSKSIVVRVGRILDHTGIGNFSLSISQITPMNIFINLTDIEDIRDKALKLNRILIKYDRKIPEGDISIKLQNSLKFSDIGLNLTHIAKTDEYEISSDRIFIDGEIINIIKTNLPGAAPVLTYLGNRFKKGGKLTPYSFISALPPALYPEVGDGMIINRWMANDLDAAVGDSIFLYWYSIDSLNKLIEKSGSFRVSQIADMKGIWADSLLMPAFPGIAGKESCSDWDAGLPIKMNDIRTKDEDYWNMYKGTPKAFISYETGKKIWGNNFGPATAMRFPAGITEKRIKDKLKGSFDPSSVGFIISDLSFESANAADKSVDFGSLFISLGFFLILASLVLLSFASSSYFDSKKSQVRTLFALGFSNKWISGLLLSETGLIGLAGSLMGAFAGYGIDIILTKALNTVWTGAVQTNTLNPYFSIIPVMYGFVITFLLIMVLILVKTRQYLRELNDNRKSTHKLPSRRNNLIILFIFILSTLFSFLLFLFTEEKITYSFVTGTLLLLTLVISWRQYYIRTRPAGHNLRSRKQLFGIHYLVNPSSAISPILFISAGIFIVFILGANRKNFSGINDSRAGGTGGYLLWCENTIPVKEDLNTKAGRKSYGLDEEGLDEIRFVQIKRQAGNDASCLNLNHITAPPLLGIDPGDFIHRKSFSFAKKLQSDTISDPWLYLTMSPGKNIIYGIADQTVLDWNLKLKTGDTLILRAENGAPLKIVIAGGLQSSVFQGNVIIGLNSFAKYFPTISGSSVLLVDGKEDLTDQYIKALNDRFENNGVIIETTSHRLESFFEVTNTYLSVFAVLGALGMIIGVAGLGFVLLRNYNQRKQEFSLMLAVGFSVDNIKSMIFSEQLLILTAGVSTGVISALFASLPSISQYKDIPWLLMVVMIGAIFLAGLSALYLSLRPITRNSLIGSLKRE
jgi:ABC-type antimicrobial peptide transport system permease subunit